jgi:excisionase family DNA binding protein
MQQTVQGKRLGRAREACERAGSICRRTLYTWQRKGLIKAYRVGQVLLFDLDDLDALVARNQVPVAVS